MSHINNTDQLIRGEFLPHGIHDWAKSYQLEQARKGNKMTLQQIYEHICSVGFTRLKNGGFRNPINKGG